MVLTGLVHAVYAFSGWRERQFGGTTARYAAPQGGWVLTALQNSFFRPPRGDLEEGIVQTAPCGGDTDTNGCIAGAPATAWGGPGTLAREGPGLSARGGGWRPVIAVTWTQPK